MLRSVTMTYISVTQLVIPELDPELWPSNKTSSMTTGDHNSGWHYVKYPMYSDDDPHQLEAAYAEIRLPEIIYMLAECKLRSGNTRMPLRF